MGAGYRVVCLVACLVGREYTRESNVVRYVKYVEPVESTHLCDQFSHRLLFKG